jgi:polyhydroxyalkanoate synthase
MSPSAPEDRAVLRLRNLLGLFTRPKPVVGATPADVVLRENKLELLRYRPREGGPTHKTPVLMVPSMINRHYVLDLRPGSSLVEYLVQQGHDVYMIRWGTPGAEDRYLTFDAVCDGYLGRCVRYVARHSERGKTHLLGYCMGGTMAAIHTAVRPEPVASLATLAAPVRFRDEAILSTWAGNESFDVAAMTRALGNAPWQLLQGTFLMQRPTMTLAKFVGLVDRAWDAEWLEAFLALETWVNDNVSLPGEAFREYIERLYKQEALVAGEFALSGRRIRLEAIRCPLLTVTFEHDLIVPWKSAVELFHRAGSPDKEHLHLKGGHVGAVVSRKAAQGLWSKLSAWWASHDADPPMATVRSPEPVPPPPTVEPPREASRAPRDEAPPSPSPSVGLPVVPNAPPLDDTAPPASPTASASAATRAPQAPRARPQGRRGKK